MTAVDSASGRVKQGARIPFGMAGASQVEYMNVGSGPGEQSVEVGQPFGITQVGRRRPVADPPQFTVAPQSLNLLVPRDQS